MATVRELRGDGTVNSVVLEDGQSIPSEMVVAGIGVRPAADLLANSGIEEADGVTVNEYLETSAPGIFAAGDVANYQDVLFQKRRRVEHWDNAVSQGQYCARALMGERTPFKHVPYFFSDVFDLSYEFWGDTSDADHVSYRGNLNSGEFSVWWLKENRLQAAFVMRRPDQEREWATKFIQSQEPVDPKAIGDESRKLG